MKNGYLRKLLIFVFVFLLSIPIFSEPLNSVFKGTVWFSNKRAANATVTISIREGNSIPQVFATVTTDENGYFYYVLPAKNLYSVIAEKDGYLSNGHSFFRPLKPGKVYNVSMTIDLSQIADRTDSYQSEIGILNLFVDMLKGKLKGK